MIETVLSAETWIGAVISTVIAGLMGWLYRFGQRHFPVILNTTWSGVRKWARARKKAYLLRIKVIRFDSMKINREIARSYAFLVLFLLAGMLYLGSVLVAPRASETSRGMLVIWGVVLGGPVLIFELLWLFSSSKVDALLKSRAKIISRGRRLR